MDILAKVKGRVDSAELFFTESSSRSVEFKGWKIRGTESTNERGWALRVIIDGKLGFCATSDADRLDDMVENAISAAKLGEKLDLTFPSKPADMRMPQIFDAQLESVTIPDLAAIAEKAKNSLLEFKTDCDGEFGCGSSAAHFRITNTEGFDAEFSKSSISLSGSVTRVREGDIYMTWDYNTATASPTSVDAFVAPIEARIKNAMSFADRIVAPPTGNCPIIFTPRAVPVILYPLSIGLNGSSIYTKSSPIFDKLGQTLFDEKFSLIDDPTLAFRAGSAPFDAEGTLKRRQTMIENGVLSAFYFDLTTAKKSGYTSNGCGTRSLFGPVSPSSSNVLIEPGTQPSQDIIASIDEGILIESVLGMGQGNVLSGAFSNPVGSAYKIEGGKIVGRVKNVAISGNVYDCLRDISAISSDREWLYGVYCFPYMRFDNISVISE